MMVKDITRDQYKEFTDIIGSMFANEVKNRTKSDKDLIDSLKLTNEISTIKEFVNEKQKDNSPTKCTSRSKRLYVLAISVGQGDMTLLKLPNGKLYLIDCYLLKNSKVLHEQEYENFFCGKTIECLIITHKHLDHYRGLSYLQKKYNVRINNLLYNMDYEHNCAAFRTLLLGCSNSKIYNVNEAQVFFEGEVKFNIINPTNGRSCKEGARDINNSSIILSLTYGKTKFLFTGDADAGIIQDSLLHSREMADDYQSGYLKISHHGSRTGTNEALSRLLANFDIQYISYGKANRYKHPHGEVLDIYPSALNSLKNGSICLCSDGKSIKYRSLLRFCIQCLHED